MWWLCELKIMFRFNDDDDDDDIMKFGMYKRA